MWKSSTLLFAFHHYKELNSFLFFSDSLCKMVIHLGAGTSTLSQSLLEWYGSFCFSVFELLSNNCGPSDSKLSNPFTSIFSHWEFLLRHSTFRMLCVSVSGWGPHWYVFLAYQELYFPSIKRLCNQQASIESLVPFLRSLFYLWNPDMSDNKQIG